MPSATKCPLDTPFTKDGRTCFQCTVEKPIFDITARECVSCPGIETFENHECHPVEESMWESGMKW